MKHPDALMHTVSVEDPIARDNFQRLNRLFANQEFALSTGYLTGRLENMAQASPPVAGRWQRVGRLITLQLDADIVVASKVNTTAPSLGAPLPANLRPHALTRFLVPIYDNGLSTAILLVDAGGNITWARADGNAWSAATAATVYAVTISYLGN